MIYAFFVLANLFLISMILSYRKILEPRFKQKYAIVYALPVNTLLLYIAMQLPASPLRVFGTLIIYIANLLVFFRTNALIAIHIGGIYVTTMYCIRGIVIASVSMVKGIAIFDVILNRKIYHEVNTLSLVITIVLFQIYHYFFVKEQRTRNFYNQRTQVKFFLVYLYASLLFLLLINDGRSIEIKNEWFAMVCLVSSVLTQVILVFTYNHLLRLSDYIERDMIEGRIIESLESKLEFYKVLETQNLSIQKFKHDYNKILSVLDYYIENEDMEGMRSYLEETNDIVNKPMAHAVQFSNHTLLDAMLQNAANRAVSLGVTFDARVSVPEYIEIKDLDLVRLFGNLIENVLSAASNVDNGFVKMVGVKKGHWFTIEIENNFDGIIKKRDGHLISTKQDKVLHGHGLKIIKEVSDRYNGVFTTQIDSEAKVFRAIVSLSLS